MKNIILSCLLIIFTFLLPEPVTATIGQPCCKGSSIPILNVCHRPLTLQESLLPGMQNIPYVPDLGAWQCTKDFEVCGESNKCVEDIQPAICTPPYGWNQFEKKCCTSDGVGNVICDNEPTSDSVNCPQGKGNVTREFVAGKGCVAKKSLVYLCLEKDGSCDTAIGQISVKPSVFISAILKLVVGVSGGIALLMLILASYAVLTSSGDPQKLAGAKEMFISVISGITLIVLSMILLNAIGIDILGLSSLNQSPAAAIKP